MTKTIRNILIICGILFIISINIPITEYCLNQTIPYWLHFIAHFILFFLLFVVIGIICVMIKQLRR